MMSGGSLPVIATVGYLAVLAVFGAFSNCVMNPGGKTNASQTESIKNQSTGHYLVAVKEKEGWIVKSYDSQGHFESDVTPRPLTDVELRQALRVNSHWINTLGIAVKNMDRIAGTGPATTTLGVLIPPLFALYEGESVLTVIQVGLSTLIPVGDFWAGERLHRGARADAIKDMKNLWFSDEKYKRIVWRLKNPGVDNL